MHTLNLGILAHVDAGKTSLTERLLHTAGVIDTIGSVDHGSTRTDSLALERRRGITIKSAVVSFTLGTTTVNLIDTPGHPDFIAEVERVLGVLDGAVLVISAVEGVQAQTRVLLRTLRRLRIPTVLFVTQDRPARRTVRPAAGEHHRTALPGHRRDGLGPAPRHPGRHQHAVHRGRPRLHRRAHRPAHPPRRRAARRVRRRPGGPPHARLLAALAEQTGRCLVHPVFFGSAATGAGIDALVEGITGLLPPPRATATAR
ncbi:Tetracycline resistance protein, tetM/tetO subfamily OS=Streptomyces microflavus OX=1919 GN=Smic_02160 PE=4 SV=1 [Streptomyces microflavus]